jgi:hypothetical protein
VALQKRSFVSHELTNVADRNAIGKASKESRSEARSGLSVNAARTLESWVIEICH